ncbi:MAG: NAD(P)/FAD-dependent oxidoreductase [Bacteroidetes bacterium]|jgi:NADH dehydrogenase|nr:NAD(P)/FAD-dependent oxidoreductase [Bacteroidota bacterium]
MKKLVIVGAGFAGLRLARTLKDKGFEIWLIDKNNYHQFPPLLYQVATCGLEPSSISFPLRKIFQSYKNVHIRCTEVNSVDHEQNKVVTSIGSFSYDYLVIATGATTNFFGNALIEKNAMPMKSVGEALFVRNKVLQNFEDALIADDQTRKALLNIVIVGGGPTGVEVSGALAEMKNQILPKDYPEIDFKSMNIYLVEAGPKVLAAFSEESAAKAKQYLEDLGVVVFTSTQVTGYDGNEVSLSTGKTLPTKSLIWAAGIKGNNLSGLPENTTAKGNRISVNRFSQINGFENIFAIGDIANMSTPKYPNGHPQVATVANMQADHLAKNLVKLKDGKVLEQFEYKDKGSMATVGRHKAVVDLPKTHFQGWLAWFFWMFLHLMLILGMKNKLLIFVNWLWNYFTFDQSLRLIIRQPAKKE